MSWGQRARSELGKTRSTHKFKLVYCHLLAPQLVGQKNNFHVPANQSFMLHFMHFLKGDPNSTHCYSLHHPWVHCESLLTIWASKKGSKKLKVKRKRKDHILDWILV